MAYKIADSKGRIALGAKFAGQMVIVDDTDPSRIILTRAVAVPEQEAWLFNPLNGRALHLVSTGLEEARTEQFAENPPNWEEAGQLAGEITDEVSLEGEEAAKPEYSRFKSNQKK